jgi:hypothetical protein
LPITSNGKKVKEYETWRGMLKRCFDDGYLTKEPTYQGCNISEEWTYYKNFYNWIISQKNYKQWKDGCNGWAIDKDILLKGNKTYSSETCLLVPQNVNSLFTTRKLHRGKYPIGVTYSKKNNKFLAYCSDPFEKRCSSKRHVFRYLGSFITQEKAFYAYKTFKEDVIKKVATLEFESGNITEKCYIAMLNYEIEIDD